MTPSIEAVIRSSHRKLISDSTRQRLTIATAPLGAIALVSALNAWVLTDPTFVDHFALRNSSAYDLHIAVGPSSSDEILLLGTAVHECTSTFYFVLDQGEEWRIQFRTQGFEATPVTVRRSELVASDWTFTIPDSVARELATLGAPPPPSSSSCPNPS